MTYLRIPSAKLSFPMPSFFSPCFSWRQCVNFRSQRGHFLRNLAVSLGFVAMVVCFPAGGRGAEESGPIDFAHEVAPILRKHCIECHGGDEAKGGFSLNSREMFLEGGVAAPGEVDDSYFLELITSTDEDLQMPPAEKDRLTAAEIDTLQRWVEEEMPWTAGLTFSDERYEPPLRPRRPELPPPRDGRNHPIDRLIDDYFRTTTAAASDSDASKSEATDKGSHESTWRLEAVDDATFMRRVHLDLIGLLPDGEDVDAFLQDQSPHKRRELIQELLSDDVRYAEHWLTFWNDLLRNDYSGTGFITGGRKQISGWLYQSLVDNRPFDQMARELIAPPTDASRGFIDGIKWRGEVSAGQTLEIQFAQSVSQSLLGINMKCASCHDSFIDRWTLKDAYGLAAIYAEEPLAISRCDKPTGETATASWLFPELGEIASDASRDERLRQLARLMTSEENGRFARTIVNRLWFQMMGRGIVHPVDAMQTEPWDADLLEFLAAELIDNDYDLKKTLELIATSEAYQSKSEPVASGDEGSDYRFAGPRSKRMTAEQFVDAVWQLTGAAPTTFDAPVMRGKADTKLAEALAISAKWIWSAKAADDELPPPEKIAFRKTFTIAEGVAVAGAMITCDNEYTLYLNGTQIRRDDDWTTVEPVSLTQHLRTGENVIVVVAANGGTDPNPAGLLFQAIIEQPSGDRRVIASDGTWQVYEKFPSDKAIAKWKPDPDEGETATLVRQDPWSKKVLPEAKQQLSLALSGGNWSVRASLLQNTPLMQTLGRPNRDQIVSSRPNTLTTLEAIHLSNSQTLSDWFARGADRWFAQDWSDRDARIEAIFKAALTRRPTRAERELIDRQLGPEPTRQRLEDLLWALCVTPEFLLIR